MDFELSRNITVGQYIPTGSWVHKLDPRIKLIVFMGLLVALSLSFTAVPTVLGLIFHAAEHALRDGGFSGFHGHGAKKVLVAARCDRSWLDGECGVRNGKPALCACPMAMVRCVRFIRGRLSLGRTMPSWDGTRQM